MDFILILGYLSVALHIWGFSTRNREKMLKIGLVSIFIYLVHISFSGGTLSTIIIVFLGLSTSVIALYVSESNRKKLIKFLPVLSLLIFMLSGMGIMSLMAAIGTFFSSYAKMQEDILRVKIFYIGSALSWLVVGVLLESIPAMLFDIVGLTVLSIEIYRIKKKSV